MFGFKHLIFTQELLSERTQTRGSCKPSGFLVLLGQFRGAYLLLADINCL